MNETGMTLAQAWNYGGLLMWVLAALSVVALAIVLYLLFAQRREALMPRTLMSDVFNLILCCLSINLSKASVLSL